MEEKWIKISERQPDEPGTYPIRYYSYDFGPDDGIEAIEYGIGHYEIDGEDGTWDTAENGLPVEWYPVLLDDRMMPRRGGETVRTEWRSPVDLPKEGGKVLTWNEHDWGHGQVEWRFRISSQYEDKWQGPDKILAWMALPPPPKDAMLHSDRWIPSDILPDDEGWYLGILRDVATKRVKVDYSYYNARAHSWEEWTSEMLAWMPIPKPFDEAWKRKDE